jgi:hypothetical protein
LRYCCLVAGSRRARPICSVLSYFPRWVPLFQDIPKRSADQGRGCRAVKLPISIVAFNDEEGARPRTSFFGSRAFIGELDLAEMARRGVAEVTSEAGFDFPYLSKARATGQIGTYPRAAYRARACPRKDGHRRRDRDVHRRASRNARALPHAHLVSLQNSYCLECGKHTEGAIESAAIRHIAKM